MYILRKPVRLATGGRTAPPGGTNVAVADEMRSTPLPAIAALLLAASAVGYGASSPPPLPPADADCLAEEPSGAEFDKAPLETVVKFVSRTACANFILSERLKPRPVTVSLPKSLTREERLIRLIEAVRAIGLRVARTESGGFVYLRICDPAWKSSTCGGKDPLY